MDMPKDIIGIFELPRIMPIKPPKTKHCYICLNCKNKKYIGVIDGDVVQHMNKTSKCCEYPDYIMYDNILKKVVETWKKVI